MIRKVYEGQVIVGQFVGEYVEYTYDDNLENKRVMSAEAFNNLPDSPAW